WRRLLVSGDYSIADLHFILQIAFDWDDWNLHRFFIHGKDYGIYHSGGMSFSDDPQQVKLADFKFRKGEKFLYEYDFFNGRKHLLRIEDILRVDPKKKYPLCTGGGNLSISAAERKAAEFDRVEDKFTDQLKDKLPAFLKEYQELINFVTDQENAGEAIEVIREKVGRLQAEAAEIKKLNQLLMPETFIRRKLNRRLLHYSQNRGRLPEEDWDEI
ncbi:MAG: plasmid pRiA4b ORF-3 family protein, partial [Pyrinomonadaceae bacterium]|nr:plasmid pRiA4b ORF-3 family protein [Pyrinomonadaceae bacterium]